MEKDNFGQRINKISAKEFMLLTEVGEFRLTLEKRVRFTPANPKSGLQFFNHQPQQPKFKKITGSNNFFLALTEAGEIYYWGRIIFAAGQAKNKNTPVLFNMPKKIEYISCSKQNCAAIDNDGQLYVWGYNKDNCLNLTASRGNLQESYIYLPVPVPHKVKFSSIAVGLHHFIAISEFGNVYIWGSNREKQLGLVETKRVFKPRLVSFPTKAKKVVCGDYHSAILLEDRNLYIIGYTDKPTNRRCDYELRLIDNNVKDVACWNGTTVYVTSVPNNKYVPKPNIARLELQYCVSWISFSGPEIHVGVKHYQEAEFKRKLEQLKLVRDFHSDQAYELLTKYGYTPLHHAVTQSDVPTILQLMEQGHDMNAKDYMDRSPFDLVIELDNLDIFQIFLQNCATRKISVKFSAETFMKVYFRENPAISFSDLLLYGSVKSLVKGIAKLLKKRQEYQVINNPNYDIMFDYLQNDEVTHKCIDHLIYLRPLAKFLKIDKFFDWFMKMHALSNGVLSTKIFLDYLCQTIQPTYEVSDLIISQARSFFSVHTEDTGLTELIPIILDEIVHLTEDEAAILKAEKRNRATTFLAATLSSKEGRTFVLKKYTLNQFYENLCQHPQRFALLKFFTTEVQDRILKGSNEIKPAGQADVMLTVYEGKECALKTLNQEATFFKEILVTSLIHHTNIIRSVAFARNSDLSLERKWSCMVVLPRYQELIMASNHKILQKMVYLHKLAEAINELHQCGVIHLDIKPENVLFDVSKRQIKLIDFSTCHLKAGMNDNFTHVRTCDGFTPHNVRGEIDPNNPEVSFGTDVFLLGILMANFILPASVAHYDPNRERTFTQKQTETLERLLSKKIALHFISLIYGCVNKNNSGRLTIENVLNKLQDIIKKMLKRGDAY